MVDIESITIVENLSCGFLNTNSILAIPSKTSNKEKNIFIARTAIISSVAVLSKYEYQFQMLGTKKCHIPKPIEIILPKVTSIFTKDSFKSLSKFRCCVFVVHYFYCLRSWCRSTMTANGLQICDGGAFQHYT